MSPSSKNSKKQTQKQLKKFCYYFLLKFLWTVLIFKKKSSSSVATEQQVTTKLRPCVAAKVKFIWSCGYMFVTAHTFEEFHKFQYLFWEKCSTTCAVQCVQVTVGGGRVKAGTYLESCINSCWKLKQEDQGLSLHQTWQTFSAQVGQCNSG